MARGLASAAVDLGGVFVVAPFHSTSNPPVGLAYLVAHLDRAGIEAGVRDLNIEARWQLRDVGAGVVAEYADELFLQSQRSYLGEAAAWSWLDPGGAEALCRRVRAHPSAEIRAHWLDTVGLERLTTDTLLASVGDALRQWLEAEARHIATSGVGWVGLSLTVSNLGAALFVARVLRRENPELTILLGGPHVNERNAVELLDVYPADGAIPASAYAPLVEVLTTAPDHAVRGAVRRGAAGDLVGDPRPRGSSMQSLPFADWSGIDLDRYDRAFGVAHAWAGTGQTDFRVVPLQTSRGCSYSKCEFCHNVIDYPEYLVQSPDRVLAELEHQIAQLGVRSFFFTDDEFNGSLRRVRQLTTLIAEGAEDIRWFAWLRLDRLTDRALEGIYRAGCREVFIGVEALVDPILAELKKGYGAELALDRLRLLAAFARTHPDFSYGFNLIGCHPCETVDDVRQTMRVIAAEPELFEGHVSAVCEYHVYEGTPGARRFGQGAPGLLDPILPPGIRLTSFRLMPRDAPRAEERRRLWREVTDTVTNRETRVRAPTALYV